MQGIPLLILAIAVLYLGRKLFSFVKAVAIQYANNMMVFLLSTISSGTPGRIIISYHRPI
jgi:hypothetical protein